MLKTLRERTKAVLWIVVLAFVISIFALWGMDLRTPERHESDADLAGTVDGEDITYQTYQNSLNQLWTQVKQERGEEYEPSEIERDMLSGQAWELAIQSRLMEREIRDLDITVSDDELVSFLRTNPHPQLIKTFVTEDGQFDYQAYLRALADPEVDWSELERWGRAVIPEIKLQTYLVGQVHIPETELLDRFKERNLTMRAQYVEIPVPTPTGAFETSDTELRVLYDGRKKDFTDPAMRRIRVIEIEKKPSGADEEDASARLADIRSDIVGGRIDFATAAAENSDDAATAAGGGDLGFFKQGEKPEVTVDEIMKTVAAKFNIRIADLKSQKKNKNLVIPRQIAMYLARRLTSHSFPDIGAKIGGKDHSTVIYANNKIKDLLEKDPKIEVVVRELEESLNRH